MEEELKCDQCHSFMTEPMWLSCCSVNLCKIHICDICPICQKNLETSDLEPNYILKYILHSTQNQKTCERCEKSKPEVYCSRCNARMCKECSSHIHSLGIFSKHILRPLDRSIQLTSVEVCPEHYLPYSLFCSEDWTALCLKCSSHDTHTILSLNETYSEVISELQAKEQKLKMKSNFTDSELLRCEESLSSLEINTEKSKTSLHKSFDQLREFIHWKEEELLLEVVNLIDKKKLQVDCLIELLTDRKSKLSYMFKLLEVTRSITPTQLLSCIKYITHKIETTNEEEEISCDSIDLPSLFIQLGKVKNHIDKISIQDIQHYQSRSKSPLNPRFNFTPDGYSSQVLTPTPIYESRIQRPSFQTLETLRKSFVAMPSNPFETSSSVPSMTNPVFLKRRSNKSVSNVQTSSVEPSMDMLEKRNFILIQQSATAIKLSWSHPFKADISMQYCLEYGIGTKTQGLEQFREVYTGTAKTCIVTDLLSKTSYRFRVKPFTPQETGEWSDTITVNTLPIDCLDINSCKNIANVTNRNGEKWIQFERPGTILSTNSYLFGINSWEVRVLASNMFSDDEDGWSLKVGVANSKNKSVVFGVVIHSNAARGHIRIKVCLDIEKKKLTCYTPSTPEGETVSVTEGIVTPAIQFKPGKSLSSNVKCNLKFNE